MSSWIIYTVCGTTNPFLNACMQGWAKNTAVSVNIACVYVDYQKASLILWWWPIPFPFRRQKALCRHAQQATVRRWCAAPFRVLRQHRGMHHPQRSRRKQQRWVYSCLWLWAGRLFHRLLHRNDLAFQSWWLCKVLLKYSMMSDVKAGCFTIIRGLVT